MPITSPTVRLASRRWWTVRGPLTKPSAASANPLNSKQQTDKVVYGTKRALKSIASPPLSLMLKLLPVVASSSDHLPSFSMILVSLLDILVHCGTYTLEQEELSFSFVTDSLLDDGNHT